MRYKDRKSPFPPPPTILKMASCSKVWNCIQSKIIKSVDLVLFENAGACCYQAGVEVLDMGKHLSDKYIIYISQSVVNASAGKYGRRFEVFIRNNISLILYFLLTILLFFDGINAIPYS